MCSSDLLATRTTAVSQAAADRFVRLKAVPAHKCLVLLNGIDAGEFTPDPDRRFLTRIAMDADNFIWLAAGRVVPAKDYPNLLLAFHKAREVWPDAQLWIAGAPADAKVKRTEDGKTLFVSLTAVEHSCLEQVHWLGLRRDMPALLDAVDAFVQPSAWEGMPLAVGEAMAMEKPVVATDVGGTRELVGDAGVLVGPKDADALAAAMLAMMQQSVESRQALGRAARARIAGRFSMNAKADEWEALYRAVLDARQ